MNYDFTWIQARFDKSYQSFSFQTHVDEGWIGWFCTTGWVA